MKHRVLSRAWLLALAKSIYYVLSEWFFFGKRFLPILILAFEKIRFSSLLAAGDVSRGETLRSSARNVPSCEEPGETDVFAGYVDIVPG